jgi:hypothetical protein
MAMKRASVILAVAVAAGLAAMCGWALAEPRGSVSVQSMPPVVVKTVPQAGDTEVDPATKEIQVVFSKKMTDGRWSWSQMSGDTFPELAGESHYLDDQKTCVLPVKLQPGHTYVLWLNSQKFHGFQDQAKQPAIPYLLVFQTGK